jgi:GNAT superfamily N-acetyltransferase
MLAAPAGLGRIETTMTTRPTDFDLRVRDAAHAELDALAALWHAGWRDAHLEIVPAALVALRTIASFTERLAAALADVRVIGPVGHPLGFHQVKGDEVYQFYVAAVARGTGAAATLMRDAEERLAARGVATPWLSCAVGNLRAARFYEKCGWQRTGTLVEPTVTSQGPFPVAVWRYEKRLA